MTIKRPILAIVIFIMAFFAIGSLACSNRKAVPSGSQAMSTTQPEGSLSDPTAIKDPELFAKWIWAYKAQNATKALLIIPNNSGPRFSTHYTEQDIQESTNKHLLVPVADLIPHMSIVEQWEDKKNTFSYKIQLDQEGQDMIIKSKGDSMSEPLRKFISGPGLVTIDIIDGKPYWHGVSNGE